MSSNDRYPYGEMLLGGEGTDPPLSDSSPTNGFKLNHFMLRIKDPKKSLHFYVNLMGMRTVFITNTGPYTIYYLGYPQTEAHRIDVKKFGEETFAKLAHTLGLLELYHIHGSEKEDYPPYSTGNDPPHLGFSQLGFTVPDVPKALEHLRSNGVKVLKELGVSTRESVPLSKWEEEQGVGLGELHANYKWIFDKIAFVADPDGYNVELVPQVV